MLDERRPVVGDNDFHSLRQRRLDLLFDGLFDSVEDVVHALAEPNDNNACGGVAHAVEIHYAPANVWANLDEADVAHENWCAVGLCSHSYALDVGRVLNVAPAAHHVLRAGEL